jgi:hypothetical protein
MAPESLENNGIPAVTMSPLLRFVNVFISPRETFASLSRSKWAWIAPVIVTFLIGLAAYPFMKTIVADERIRNMEKSPLFERLPESQKEEIFESTRESILNPPWYNWALGIAGAFVAVLLAGALMLLVANPILGGETKLWMMMNVYAFSALIAIPEAIVKVPFVVTKQTLDIRTSLAIILPADDTSSFTYALLNNIDIFSIWMVALIVVGMSVLLPKASTNRIAVPIAFLWLIWVVINSAMEHFIGGGFGF